MAITRSGAPARGVRGEVKIVTPALSGAAHAAGGARTGAGTGAGAEAEAVTMAVGGGDAGVEHAAMAKAASQAHRCISPDYLGARQGQILR
jgi:hypothetical protein